MPTFLWESIAFGPIHSRRLGQSLGVNLLPTDVKICSFDCLYCECGWTLEKRLTAREFYEVSTVLQAIEHKLQECKNAGTPVDSITFSGNGEPTLHPYFDQIIDGLIPLRDKYYPHAVISCLSNATQLMRPEVCSALKRIENPILKLDAGNQEMLNLINGPVVSVDIQQIVKELCTFNGNVIIQTMFLSGEKDGVAFDNSQEPNFGQWLDFIQKIQPKKVMIYSLDRETPASQLHQFDKAQLEVIATSVRALGIPTETY
ncbi:MAG: radical SAM protein [Bacteroidales bacterium]|nr:radical SAM protein [Bacteroidales bacterium]